MRAPDATGKGYELRFPAFGADGAVTSAELAEWRAWKCVPPATAIGDMVENGGPGLETWILHAPGSHGIWTWLIVSGCSLADVAGFPPAIKAAPENTHEVMVIALQNGCPTPPSAKEPEPPPPDPDDPRTWKRLTPPNLIAQVAGLNDEAANQLVTLLVRAFLNGTSSPDSDFTAHNVDLIRATAEHLAQGKHLPT